MTTREKTSFWAIGLAVTIALLWVLHPILLPFVAAMAVAYFLDPVCDWLEARKFSRTAATALVTAVFFIIVVLFFSFVGPMLYSQVAELLQRIPGYVAALQEKAGPFIALIVEQFDEEQARELGVSATQHVGTALRFGANAIARFVGGIGALVDILSLLVLTPIVSFYLLRDWDRIVERIDSWLPRAQADDIRRLATETDEILAGFVRGQSSVCAMLGLFYGIGLTAVGLDFGFIVGLFTGLVSFIPYFGMLIGLAVGFGIAFVQFDAVTPFLLVGAVFLVGQLIEGNFLTPKLVGGRVKLHEVWIIFALLAGGAVFGFLGILMAVPIAAVIGVGVRFALERYLESPLYDGGPLLQTDDDAPSTEDPPQPPEQDETQKPGN